jgi:hypothetical protein
MYRQDPAERERYSNMIYIRFCSYKAGARPQAVRCRKASAVDGIVRYGLSVNDLL